MNNIPHPFQYQGSKRNLAFDILEYFPDFSGKLIEPFAGSSAMSIAAASTKQANQFLLNDLNKPLIELLQNIIESPKETSDAYEKIWNEQHEDSENHYYQIREQFNDSENPFLFLYLLSRCVKGAVRYNSEGKFNQSPDKRRFGTRPSTMRENIKGVSSLLKGKTKFSSCSYLGLRSAINQDDLVYMDPPYQGVCGDKDLRYFSAIRNDEFINFLDTLNQDNIMYIVSYDGRTGEKTFGNNLPEDLKLKRIEIKAGRSSQSTLLGKNEITYESLYVSKSLLRKLDQKIPLVTSRTNDLVALF